MFKIRDILYLDLNKKKKIHNSILLYITNVDVYDIGKALHSGRYTHTHTHTTNA